jgi:hypothetical protein
LALAKACSDIFNNPGDRLKTETDNLTIIASRLKETIADGVEKVDKMEDDFKGLMKQSLLISITHMSRRIKELR